MLRKGIAKPNPRRTVVENAVGPVKVIGLSASRRGGLAVHKFLPADALFVAVPNPLSSDKNPNIGYVKAAAGTMATRLRAGDLVIHGIEPSVRTIHQIRPLGVVIDAKSTVKGN